MKKNQSKATDVHHLSAEAEPTLTSLIPERVVFTAEEHLGAQRQIEGRAHELWCAGGCRHGTTLSDWLQAESEILGQFTWVYARRHALQQSSARKVSVSVVRKKPEPRILKHGQTFPASEPQPTYALA
jgi:hypothetical protein